MGSLGASRIHVKLDCQWLPEHCENKMTTNFERPLKLLTRTFAIVFHLFHIQVKRRRLAHFDGLVLEFKVPPVEKAEQTPCRRPPRTDAR